MEGPGLNPQCVHFGKQPNVGALCMDAKQSMMALVAVCKAARCRNTQFSFKVFVVKKTATGTGHLVLAAFGFQEKHKQSLKNKCAGSDESNLGRTKMMMQFGQRKK